MQIGILTFHRALNCGAMLQAWALRQVLQRMGHQVGFVPNHVGELPRWLGLPRSGTILGRIRGFCSAVPRNLLSIGCYGKLKNRCRAFQNNHLPEIDLESCDAVVVGSDQVWRDSLTGNERGLFHGDSIPEGLPLVAYAASIGDAVPPPEQLSSLARSTGRYFRISVREALVAHVLEPLSRREMPVVVDPTLLLTRLDFTSIANIDACPKQPFLFAYAVHATPFFCRTAQSLAKRMGLGIVITAACQTTRYCAPRGLTYAISPDRMVGCIANAQCVVASSFHGTALALLHDKPFISLRERSEIVESRPASLLRQVGENGRLCTPASTLDDMEKMLKENPSPLAQVAVKDMRANSLKWLTDTVNAIRDGGNNALLRH